MPKPKPTKKEKLGVKIVVELTGHLPRTEVDQFMAALTSVVNNHLENGGNGGKECGVRSISISRQLLQETSTLIGA